MSNSPERFDAAEVKAAAIGRMPEILARLGVAAAVLDGKNHPCPKCGGDDRFYLFSDFEQTGGCGCRKCPINNADIFATVQWLTGGTFSEAVATVAKIIGSLPASRPNRKRKQNLGELVATYDYRDESENLVFQVVRYEPKSFRQRKPRPGGGWDWSVKGIEAIPYRLPELLSEPDEIVFICEGERDVESVRRLGLLATCNAGGAGKWTDDHSKHLKGRKVVFLPDHDDAGEKHLAVAGKSLSKVADLKVLRLPGLDDRQDISDWIDAGGTKKQLIELANGAPNWTPKATPKKRRQPRLTRMTDIEPRPIQWLWPGRIAEGRLAVISGIAGLGKSFLTCDMAARVSTGADWPDGSPCKRGSVVFASMEDDPHDTIRPRLDAHNADVSRIHLLEGVTVSDDDEAGDLIFTLQDVQTLEAVLDQVGDCRLVVIDPIGSYLGSGTNSFKDNEVRAVLAPVAKLAERFGVAMVIVAHKRKSSGSYADDTVMGSRAFTAIARTVFHLSPDNENKERRLFLPGKSNIAATAKGLAFTLSGDPAAVNWEPDPIDMTADDAMAMEGHDNDVSAVDEAMSWLENALAAGPRSGKEIQDASRVDGIANRTLRRAKDKLNITCGPDGYGGPWVWRLPTSADQPESTTIGQDFAELANNQTVANSGDTVADCENSDEWGVV